MKLRLYLVLLCVAVFSVIITVFAVIYSGIPYVYFYSPFVFVIVLLLIYNYLVGPLTEEMGGKKVLLIVISVTIMAVAFTQSARVIASPKWAFSISTDKSTYNLGEEVHITVSLENQGFITHSFESRLSDPIVVAVEYEYPDNPVTTQVWYNPYHEEPTEFHIQSGQHLERGFLWNQTNTANPWSWNTTYKAGIYQIWAFIPKVDSLLPSSNPLFSTWTTINVTSN